VLGKTTASRTEEFASDTPIEKEGHLFSPLVYRKARRIGFSGFWVMFWFMISSIIKGVNHGGTDRDSRKEGKFEQPFGHLRWPDGGADCHIYRHLQCEG
jgi:hypothetical protein